MKTKLLTAILFLIVTSTQVLAARPSWIGSRQQGVDTLLNDLVVCPSNAPTRFTDNGDGTICDRDTGLMWEKKTSEAQADDNNPNDVANYYNWSTNTDTDPDGTTFTDFLPRLNGEIAGSSLSEQLGGHSDWRLPTSAELQTIVDCSFGTPCIDPIFGPTATGSYWSSTSVASHSSKAWFVYFADGSVNSVSKGNAQHVRAVRGGR